MKAIDCERGGARRRGARRAPSPTSCSPAAPSSRSASRRRPAHDAAPVEAARAPRRERRVIGAGSVVVASGGARGVTAACLVALARALPPALRAARPHRARGRAARRPRRRRRAPRSSARCSTRPRAEGATPTPPSSARRGARARAAARSARRSPRSTAAGRRGALRRRRRAATPTALERRARRRAPRVGPDHRRRPRRRRARRQAHRREDRRAVRPGVRHQGRRPARAARRRPASDPLRVARAVLLGRRRAAATPASATTRWPTRCSNKVAAAERARRGAACVVRVARLGSVGRRHGDAALEARFAQLGVPLIPLAAGARMFVDELAAAPDEVEVVLGGAAGGGAARRRGGAAPSLEVRVDAASHPYLADHASPDVPVVPVVLALEWFARAPRPCRPDLACASVPRRQGAARHPARALRARRRLVHVRCRQVAERRPRGDLASSCAAGRHAALHARGPSMARRRAAPPPTPSPPPLEAVDAAARSTTDAAVPRPALPGDPRASKGISRDGDRGHARRRARASAGRRTVAHRSRRCSTAGCSSRCSWAQHVLGGASLPMARAARALLPRRPRGGPGALRGVTAREIRDAPRGVRHRLRRRGAAPSSPSCSASRPSLRPDEPSSRAASRP